MEQPLPGPVDLRGSMFDPMLVASRDATMDPAPPISASPLPPGALLGPLLRSVSRSFYLTLRVLPGAIRRQVGLAYLLARATDTIADTEMVPLSDRLAALQSFRDRILGNRSERLRLEEWSGRQSAEGERALLLHSEDAFELLEQCSDDDQERIRQVLEIIVSGQELDLTRFAGATGGAIRALETDAELDDYTYRVAGCVGEFWTRLCRAHLFPNAPVAEDYLMPRAVRFGQGLQLVNILRDLPGDLRRGRCYLPLEILTPAGLAPEDLKSVSAWPRFRPVYRRYLRRAEEHLAAGWEYTNALPRRCFRLRLACAWPILIGLETLKRLDQAEILAAGPPVKVSRAECRRLMARTVVNYPWPQRWERLFAEARVGESGT